MQIGRYSHSTAQCVDRLIDQLSIDGKDQQAAFAFNPSQVIR